VCSNGGYGLQILTRRLRFRLERGPGETGLIDRYVGSTSHQGFRSASISSGSGARVLKTIANPDTDPRLEFRG